MKSIVGDIETDGLDPTVIWCAYFKNPDTGESWLFRHPIQPEDLQELTKHFDKVIFHNGIKFDVPVIRKLLGIPFFKDEDVVDTFVLSRLVQYPKFNTHSLEEIGLHYKVPKGNFKDFSQLSDEMVEYMKQDVEITCKLWKNLKRFYVDPEWEQAIKVEHDIQRICLDLQNNGFKFEKEKALEYLSQIKKRMEDLEVLFQTVWPPTLVEVDRIQYRVRTDGVEFKSVKQSRTLYPKVEVEGEQLIRYDYERFDPASPKKRIDKLWDAGWKPTEKTKGHNKFLRERRRDVERAKKFERYGWTCSEENLSTLPPTAPEGAKRLAEWLTLEGRRSSLEEWLGEVKGDGRIHGTFWGIGSWTHRMSHSKPNSANIFSPFHGEPRNTVEEIKAEYDRNLRALWSSDNWLVGTDAEGIQLRILAHKLQNEDYAHSIVAGRKEDQTDVHNVNMRALGEICRSRDDAKTFIYAWLLGAGIPKVARILNCRTKDASNAVQKFMSSIDGLSTLKNVTIPYEARRGYFTGVDGRKVLCDSEHLMLAGHLQNGEACVMKHANVLWRQWADEESINYKQVNFVHDEWQTEVNDSRDAAERLGELQRLSIEETGKRLKLFCPLAGSTDIGKTWSDTH